MRSVDVKEDCQMLRLRQAYPLASSSMNQYAEAKVQTKELPLAAKLRREIHS